MIQILAAITVCLALVGVGLVLSRPHWALLLIVIMYALEQLLQSYVPLFRTHYALFNYGVAMLAGFAMLLRIAKGEPVGSGMKCAAIGLIYTQFLLWLLGMLYSPAPDVALLHLQANWPYMLLLLVVMPLLVVELPEVRQVMIGLLVVGPIIAVLLIVNPNSSYHAGRLVVDLGMVGEGREQFGNPLATAELGGVMALVAALIQPSVRARGFTLLRTIAFVCGLGLAIGSGSRGQVFATVVAGVIFYPVAKRVNNVRSFFLTAIGLLVLMGGVYLTFKLFIGEQNQRRWDIALMVEHVTLRFDMASSFLQEYIARPSHWLFGLGTNSWTLVSGASDTRGNYVHNVAVEILCEQGIFGAAVFVISGVLALQEGRRLWALHADDPALRSTTAILLALSAYTLFLSLKEGSITAAMPFYWWLILVKVSRHERSLAATHAPAPDVVDLPDVVVLAHQS